MEGTEKIYLALAPRKANEPDIEIFNFVDTLTDRIPPLSWEARSHEY